MLELSVSNCQKLSVSHRSCPHAVGVRVNIRVSIHFKFEASNGSQFMAMAKLTTTLWWPSEKFSRRLTLLQSPCEREDEL